MEFAPLRNIQKRNYVKASNEQRRQIIYLCRHKKFTIRDAANHVGIGYENAKQILKVYHRQGRMHSLANRPIQRKQQQSTECTNRVTHFSEKDLIANHNKQLVKKFVQNIYQSQSYGKSKLPPCPINIKQQPQIRRYKYIPA